MLEQMQQLCSRLQTNTVVGQQGSGRQVKVSVAPDGQSRGLHKLLLYYIYNGSNLRQSMSISSYLLGVENALFSMISATSI